MADIHRLSQAAFDRLASELAELSGEMRIEIARKIQTAREMGDLKENGDYHAAKEEQGKMEARIRHLTAIMENCEIIENTNTEEVAHGCIVTICYEGDTTHEQYLLGSIEERHGDVDVISPGSPLGEALMGAKAGEKVSYEAPGGRLQIEIISISM